MDLAAPVFFFVWRCYSFFFGMQTRLSLDIVVVPVVWHHPRERATKRVMKQQLPGCQIAGLYKLCTTLFWTTVKAGTQERGTEHGTEVMWFHKGNYTETIQEVMINGSFPPATSCNSSAQPYSVGAAAYP